MDTDPRRYHRPRNGFVLNTDDWDGGVGGNAEIDAGADFFLSAVDGNLKLDYNIRFFITRGWTISKDEARAELGDADSLKHTDSTNATALEWYVSNTADVTRVYDLIHWDSTSLPGEHQQRLAALRDIH